MKKLISLLALAAIAIGSYAAERPKYEFAYGDTVRTYTMYLPDSLPQGAPLVVYAHGYGSKTRWRDGLNAEAKKHKFAVCYPDGAPDSRGKDGWKVGYPPQASMRVDEADFMEKLLAEVTRRFNLSRDNCFLAGMSNGGDLCYQLMYTRPELFRAYASVAGLTFEEAYLPNKLSLAVPFMEIHGNDDHTSMFTGDHLNTGGWGAYIPVPLAVQAIAANNKCTTALTDTIESRAVPGMKIFHTKYSGSPTGADVELYEVDGGKHSWFQKEADTGRLVWEFFSQFIKK